MTLLLAKRAAGRFSVGGSFAWRSEFNRVFSRSSIVLSSIFVYRKGKWYVHGNSQKKGKIGGDVEEGLQLTGLPS